MVHCVELQSNRSGGKNEQNTKIDGCMAMKSGSETKPGMSDIFWYCWVGEVDP